MDLNKIKEINVPQEIIEKSEELKENLEKIIERKKDKKIYFLFKHGDKYYLFKHGLSKLAQILKIESKHKTSKDLIPQIEQKLNVKIEKLNENIIYPVSEINNSFKKEETFKKIKLIVAFSYVSIILVSPLFPFIILLILYWLYEDDFILEHIKNIIVFTAIVLVGILVLIILVLSIVGFLFAIFLFLFLILYYFIIPLIGAYYSLKGKTEIPGIPKI